MENLPIFGRLAICSNLVTELSLLIREVKVTIVQTAQMLLSSLRTGQT